MFSRLGPWCHDRRWMVLIAWVVLLFVGFGVSGAVGDAFRDEFNRQVESKTGFDLLDEHFGGQGTGITGTIVFQAEQGVDDPAVQAAMEALFAEVAEIEDVVRVESPYARRASSRSASGATAPGRSPTPTSTCPRTSTSPGPPRSATRSRRACPEIDGLRIELGGFIFAEFEQPSSELLGLAFAIVILIVAFGSVLAMGLPVGVALFGIGIGTALITLAQPRS